MRCHYEVLGLEENCTTDDLKKAYRKLALEWHPDKNLSRLEEAKENFQLIQQAYEILSDPQERAWYDRHKDDILKGGAEQAYKDDCLDVSQYFNTSCYKGYNDGEKGFYTIFREVFEKITSEDKPFMDDEDMEVPQFGYSYSSYDEVRDFYGYWQSYCTSKSFSWVDKYDLSEARKSGAGRQIIRVLEKENKKLRDQHKKQRNEEVRELVAFVKKRDKRVQAQKKLMEEMKAEKAKKAEELRRKRLQERNKALEDYKETEWSSMSQFENHLNEMESALDATFGGDCDTNENEDDQADFGELYCIACEKDFRSEKAFKNHENSKKHKENVALLKTLMEEEEEEVCKAAAETIDENSLNEDAIGECDSEEKISSDALLDELIKSSTKSKKKKKKNKDCVSKEMDEGKTLSEVELAVESINISDKIDSIEGENNIPKEENIDVKSKPLNETKSASRSENIKKKSKKDIVQKSKCSSTDINEEKVEKSTTICGTCNNNFSSRNKLFEHLKQTGHAVYKNEDSSSASGKKQKKKKL